MVLLSPTAKKLFVGIAPGIAAAVLYWYTTLPATRSAFLEEFIAVSPYLLIVISAGMGWFFNHHRVVYVMVLLGIAYAGVTSLEVNGQITQHQRFVVNSLGFFLPLNMLVIAYLQERRSFFNARTLTFVILVAFQLTTAYWLYSLYPKQLYNILMFPMGTGQKLIDAVNLPFPVLFSFGFAITAMIIRLLRNYSTLESGLLWALVISLLAFNTEGSHPHFSLFLTLATLVIAVSLLQTWYDFAYLDQLTGLPGRLALNETIKNVSGDYVIAMVDVDFFKKCNDQYGHDVGDQILKLVASKLRQVSGGGMPYRYGGEEFLILFPNKGIKEAFPHLSALREVVEESHMILRSTPRPAQKPATLPARKQPLRYINVTVSIGLAEKNDELESVNQVIKAADEALYRAKERGRNRLSL